MKIPLMPLRARAKKTRFGVRHLAPCATSSIGAPHLGRYIDFISHREYKYSISRSGLFLINSSFSSCFFFFFFPPRFPSMVLLVDFEIDSRTHKVRRSPGIPKTGLSVPGLRQTVLSAPTTAVRARRRQPSETRRRK